MSRLAATLAVLSLALDASAQSIPLLRDADLTAIANELSGESAMRTVEGLARHHRMRGSRGFRAASEQVVTQLRQYGLADAAIESYPADGEIFYGTQRSRPPWNVEFAELWEVGGERIASWDAVPMTLAQDSERGEVTAELIDAGEGTREADYEGKDVHGKLVLVAAQPSAVAELAVGKYGAAGILSYAQNQRTAWWKEDETLVRWGHLDTFAKTKTFAFMLSLQQARAFQERLRRGETVRLGAKVRAGQEKGAYDVATATIAGSDPALRGEEIVFSCHMDHPRPGANDNASGCAAILEVARTLSKLVAEKKLAPPKRTLRFVWPPEIEGTLALLTASGRAARTRAAIHLDMVGGGPATKAIFHITRGPASLPSFVYDVAEEVGELVNEETKRYASSGTARWPLVAGGGGKEALQAALVPFTRGSDHEVYTDSSFGIPAIYLNDWPDRYIHTTGDVAANIDPTKLERAAFIAAASGYILASLAPEDAPVLREVVETRALTRRAAMVRKRRALGPSDATNLTTFLDRYEAQMLASIPSFFAKRSAAPSPAQNAYRRNPELRGPMSAFGYDWLEAHHPRARELKLQGDAAYEALNLVDGRRTPQEIRDILSAIYAPVPLEHVEEFLAALREAGAILRGR